jgi:membrane protein
LGRGAEDPPRARPRGALSRDAGTASTPARAAADRPGRRSRAVAFAARLARVLQVAVRGFFTDRCQRDAAAIAYRALFAFAPLSIVLVSIFGLILQNDAVRQDVLDAIVDALPLSAAGRKDAADALAAIATPASAAGLLSLAVFAWAATGMMTAVREGLETAMHVTESRPLARGKLVDLVLIAGTALLLLVTVGLTLLGEFLQRASGVVGEIAAAGSGTVGGLLLRVAVVALSAGVVLLVYRFVPARGLRIRDGVFGAILTALLFQAIAVASGWIYHKTTRFSLVYGSLTAALVFLYSVYLYSSALLFGAEAAGAWSRPGPVEGGRLLPRMRLSALRRVLKRSSRHGAVGPGPGPDDLV